MLGMGGYSVCQTILGIKKETEVLWLFTVFPMVGELLLA